MKLSEPSCPNPNPVIVTAEGYTVGRQTDEIAFNPILMTALGDAEVRPDRNRSLGRIRP